jgi:streptomycin 3"-adenylyltransferase
MSVVLKEHCKNFIYPTPYELHFSNACRMNRYLENPLMLCNVATDYDSAAHFTVIKNAGQVLFGKPIAEIFGHISKPDYLDSICLDIENAKESVLDNPVYVILNLCRVYAYIRDGVILSKEQGGQWGLKNLSNQYHNLLTHMLNNYAQGTTLTTNPDLQVDFCEYMLDQIANSTNKHFP